MKPLDDSSASPGARAWVALGMLSFIYVLNFLDRQLLAILAKPIQDTLHVSDSQLGLIGGLYFAAFYCFLAIPVGWLADRSNRVKVLSYACALWSLATMACGLARTYPQLVVARMTVGVGEAGGVPPSYAIISDYFPKERRGTALGIFNLGPPIGAALGVAFGAAIAAAYSWRAAFIVLGVVGLVAALAFALMVREPQRGGLDGAYVQPVARTGFIESVKRYFARPEFVLVSLSCAANQFVTYGLSNFTTLFLMREKGMTLNDVALWYALVVGFGMGGGIYVSGLLVDRLLKRSKQAAYAYLPAIALAVALPFYIGFVWAPSWPLALALLLVPSALNYFFLTSSVTMIQQEVAPDQRVISGALHLLVMNFIGLGLGPTFVGMASDAFRAITPEHSLQYALYLLAPFYLVSIALFLWLGKVLRRKHASSTPGATS